ncbi:hypothetical protein D3C73_934960 [compost metagenome]
MKINHNSDHSSRRREEYPDITEQLDALWHAMESGQLPKIPGFYDKIKEVKDRYPKATE